MYSNTASQLFQPEQMLQHVTVDTATLAAGAPVCQDVAKISGATHNRGAAITDLQAVASFGLAPAVANLDGFIGVAVNTFAAGDQKRIVTWGPVQARVRNAGAASLALAVGDHLQLSPGNDYFVPVTKSEGTTPDIVVANNVSQARVKITKAVTIAATTTQLCQVFVWPPTAPRPFSLPDWGGTITADVVKTALIAPGPGLITAAGIGTLVCGTGGSLQLDVDINGTSIFTTLPKIEDDGTDPCHTLNGTAAAATELGAAGTYGVLKVETSRVLVRGDIITRTYDFAASWDGTGTHSQIDGLWF